ncbi:MAG: LEA type 2 family protein [Ferruginibacter sp.]
MEKLGFASSAVKMDLVYYNPNSFGLQLKRTDLDVYIEGTYLGRTSQEYQITIPKKAEFNIPIKIDVDMKNLLKNGFTALSKKEVLVKVVGSVKIGKANVFKTFKVNYEGKQSFSLFE